MTTKKTTTSKVVNTKVCITCNSELKEADFYKSRNDLMDNTFSICKNCACREANQSVDSLHKILMILDIPFMPDIYKECEGMDNMFSQYMLRINNPKKKYEDSRSYSELRYSDSPTLSRVTDVDSYIYASDDKLSELYFLFGDKFKKETLLSMNKELDEMIVQYGGKREDMPTIDLYCELIRLKWLAREQMDNGNIKDGKALLAERNKMLKENNLTLQAMKEKSVNESFGVEIDYAEDEPIEPDKKYFDYSGIWFMFQKLIAHMERFRGINKQEVDEDYKEMKEYTESHPDFMAEMTED